MPSVFFSKYIKQNSTNSKNSTKKKISNHLTISHLELLFLTVLALPKASRTGFDCTMSVTTTNFLEGYKLKQ